MTTIQMVSKCLLALLLVGAGVMHFANSSFFLKIVPPYLPYHRAIVSLSGICEIALGIALLVPQCSPVAAWGIVVLFIAVFPANIYLYQHQEIVPASPMMHLMRLLLQAPLILWAYWHTRTMN